MTPLDNNTSPSSFRKFSSILVNPKLMLPVILLEGTVVSGRTYQAYKRGGKDEARERIIEELTGSVFWLGGIKMFGMLGDFIGKKLFGFKDLDYDAGSDAVRNPIKNLPAGVNPKKYAAFKLAKIISSVVIATTFLGFVVPKINHAITDKILKKKDKSKDKVEINNNSQPIKETKTNNSAKNFKGLPTSVAGWAHNLENHAIYNLFSMDTGVFVGRSANARNNDERREIMFRDGTSSFFYLFASPLVFTTLKGIDNKFCKGNANLDQMAALKVHNHLLDEMKKLNKTELSVEEFQKLALGNLNDKAFNKLKFNNGVIKLSEFLSMINDSKYVEKANQMSKLQFVQKTGAILTEKQARDVLTDSWISNPEFLSKTLNYMFSQKENSNILSDPKVFIANVEVDKARNQITDYVQSICEYAKKHSSNITPELLKKVNRRNLIHRSIYGAAAFGTAALFLSTLIPKMQYYITQKKTGKNEFPGIREEDKNKNQTEKSK